MKALRYIWLLLALLTVGACRRESGPEDASSGTGSIVLTLSSRDHLSVQTKDVASDLSDGLSFRNVLVVLTDNNNIVVGKQYIEEAEVAGVVTPVNTKTITFNNLSPGTYFAYAYANIDRYQWQNFSAKIENEEGGAGLGIGDDFSSYLNRQLNQLTTIGNDVPVDPVEAMLLTGKLEIVVNLTRVPGTLSLHRPVVRLNVIVENTTEYDVRVDKLSFSHFNADKAYLMAHTDSDGKPVLPAGTAFRSLPDYDTAHPAVVGDGEEETVYTTYLYENRSPNPYKVFATLTLMRGDNPNNYLEMSLGERDFGPISFETLDAMDEGESVDILLFNPQKTYRSGRLFYGISSENYLLWESAGYGAADALFGRAQAVYNEYATDPISGDPGYTYTGYTYNTTNGYSAWDGITSHDGKTDNGFDYTGAKSKYFRRLSKSGGKFTLDGLAVSPNKNGGPVSASSISDLTIVKGNPTGDKLKKLADGIKDYFIKFQNAQRKSLVAEVHYGSVHKESLLYFDTDSEHQGRQFIVYGKYCSGGLLNRLLSGSNREEELTYMSRNEDINVTISVFYADQDGTLTFRVDNGDWTTNIITPSHTFN